MKNYQAIFLNTLRREGQIVTVITTNGYQMSGRITAFDQNTLRREGQIVTVITTNGYQMSGRITAFDQDALVIEGKDGQQLTYKHAISTIVPERPVDLTDRKGES